MGAAELGLHLLHEVPELALARSIAAADPVGAARGTWGDLCGGAYVPALLTYDVSRLHVETRPDAAGVPRLLVTTLEDVPLPLIRYDLGDVAMVLGDAAVAALAARTGVPLPAPLVALAGRGAHLRTASGRACAPRRCGSGCSGTPPGRDLTGRFRLRASEPGGVLECHLEARERTAPGPGVEAALRDLERWLWELGGVPTRGPSRRRRLPVPPRGRLDPQGPLPRSRGDRGMNGLTVVLSDQLAEIDQAMALVHDGFVESGFMEPEASGRRAIPHY